MEDLKNIYDKNEIKEKEEFNSDEFSEESDFDGINDDNDKINENFHYSNNFIENNFNCLNKFKVYFFLKIDNSNEFVYPIETDFLNIKNQYGYDLIKNVIQKINEKKIIINLNSINYIVSLKDCEDENNKMFIDQNYELRPFSIKTYKPKFDCPKFCSNSLLKEFINENISFISKNEINIMLIENYGDIDINEDNEEYKGTNEKEELQNENIFNEAKNCLDCCLLI